MDWMIPLTATIAVTTVVYAALTFWIASEARAARLAQTDPCIVVFAKHDKARPSVMLLVVQNVGKGIAYDVQFRPSRPLPAHAFGIEIPKESHAKVMESGPLVTGIPALGPGDSRTIVWGQYGGLKAALGDSPLEVVAEFRSATRAMPSLKYHLEVDSFFGCDATDPDGTRQCADQLKKIASAIERCTRSGQALRIEVVDLKAEREAAVRQPERTWSAMETKGRPRMSGEWVGGPAEPPHDPLQPRAASPQA